MTLCDQTSGYTRRKGKRSWGDTSYVAQELLDDLREAISRHKEVSAVRYRRDKDELPEPLRRARQFAMEALGMTQDDIDEMPAKRRKTKGDRNLMVSQEEEGRTHLRDWLKDRIAEQGLREIAAELLLPAGTLKCVLDLDKVNGALLRHLRDYRAKVDGEKRQSLGKVGAALSEDYAEGQLDFSGGDYAGDDLHGVWLPGANFSYSDLSGADLQDVWLLCGDLSVANLESANLAGAILADTELVGANLAGANLAGSGLAAANLSHANFEGACARDACLAAANLKGAKLKGTRFDGADLLCADLTGAFIDGAVFDRARLTGAKLPPGVTVSEERDDGEAAVSRKNGKTAAGCSRGCECGL